MSNYAYNVHKSINVYTTFFLDGPSITIQTVEIVNETEKAVLTAILCLMFRGIVGQTC